MPHMSPMLWALICTITIFTYFSFLLNLEYFSPSIK